ncbi:MAG: alpha/beta hydrolase [Steroidobacteraceae bacterium]
MSVSHLIDPELAPMMRILPVNDLTDIDGARVKYAELVQLMQAQAPDPHVARHDLVAPARGEHPAVKLRIFRPLGVEGSLPCVYWIQGGGYVLTSPAMDDQWCEGIVSKHSCAVVSVDWRRAPEHAFPAASEDCYTGLAWVVREGERIGIDARRIVIAGHSSGGGSAASLALLVRDRAEFSVAHQMLIYPMLDDRNDTPSSYQVTDANLWNRECNEIAWRHYLGPTYGTDNVSPYAAPARMRDLSGSIPASILTGGLDLFCDENVLYALRLMQAGVPTELHVYPGAPHGFDRIAPQASISRCFYAERDAIISRVFNAGSRQA